MKKLFLLIITTCIASLGAWAQTSSVSATITDSTSQAYANGTYDILFRPAPGVPGTPSQNGSAFTQHFSGVLDASGAFAVTLTRNDFIQPGGSQWTFTICPLAASACFTSNQTIAAASVNLTAPLHAVTPVIQVFALGNIPSAYSSSEIVVTPKAGQFFWNLTTNLLTFWNGSAWAGTITDPGETLVPKVINGVRQIDVANLAGWSGADVGAWINTACTNIGANCSGKIQLGPGTYTFSTPINGDLSIATDIGGVGGLSGGANTGTALVYTGTGSPILTRSSAGFHFHNLTFTWNNASIVGPIVNNGHTGSGCGGGGCDSSSLEIDHVLFGGSVAVPIIVDLNKSIDVHLHDNFYNNYVVAIRGTDGTVNGYANGVAIDGVNQFLDTASGTAILNPSQGWTVAGTEIMEMNGVGSKVFDVSNSAITITNGLDITGLWVGDGATGTSQTLMNFCGTGINIHGNFIAGGPTSSETAISTSCGSIINVHANLIESVLHPFNWFTSTRVIAENNDLESIGGSLNAGSTPSLGRMDAVGGQSQIFQPLYLPDGSASIPSLTFAGGSSSGFFRDNGTGLWNFTFGGTAGWATSGQQITAPSGGGFGFSSNANPVLGTTDTLLNKSLGAGILCAGNSSVPNCNGTFAATHFFTQHNLISANNPSIAGAGCGGAAASILSSNGSAAFVFQVGTTPGTQCTITMPDTASSAWACPPPADLTNPNTTGGFNIKQTNTTSTTVSFTFYNAAGTATAPTASDHISVGGCMEY